MGAYRVDELALGGPLRTSRWTAESSPKRIGFVGRDAEAEVRERYLHKRVPARYRRKGAQTAFRYLSPP